MAPKFGKYLNDMKEKPFQTTMRTPGKFVEGAADIGMDAAVGLGRMTRFTKNTEPGIANLWTGKKEGIGAIGAAAAVGGAYAYAGSHKQTTLAPKIGTVSYGGAPPVMDADGVSTTPQAPMGNAPTLGAGGNMVFGLHNARKG